MPKPKIPKSVSQYMASLAHRANAMLRGSEAAKVRAQKAAEGRRKAREERKQTAKAGNKRNAARIS